MKSSWINRTMLIAAALVVAFAVAVGSAETDTKKPAKPAAKPLPRLLELGSEKCMPCRMMKPILAELEKEYAGQLKVEVIDVAKQPSVASKYKIRSIPTQIFFDAKGKEIFRHVGYYPKADILKAFKDKGVKLTPPAKPKK